MTITTGTLQIVLVEDSDDDFDTVCEALRLSGLPAELHRVSNGDECLALLRRGSLARPAFVLMDLNTSSTDGLDTLAQIKADPLLKATPVVVVTTSAHPRDVDDCYHCGANAYHVKPVSYPEHLQLLTGLLDYWIVAVRKPSAQRLLP